MKKLLFVCLPLICICLMGCATSLRSPTQYTNLTRMPATVNAEHLLLDVGVVLFDPGLNQNTTSADEVFSADVRQAEAQYFPSILARTLRKSQNWGAIRVVPEIANYSDVVVHGEILESNSEVLRLAVVVTDASGKQWFSKSYKERIAKIRYSPEWRREYDPFQGLYNRIANDINQYRRQLDKQMTTKIRTISQLRFASSLIPDIYGTYIQQARNGAYSFSNLPANNDPVFIHITEMQTRNALYLDMLQQHYATYYEQLKPSYNLWHRQVFNEITKQQQLKSAGAKRIFAGAAVLLATVALSSAADNSDEKNSPRENKEWNKKNQKALDNFSKAGGAVAGVLIKSGFDKRAEARFHSETIDELNQSLQLSIQPHTIKLLDRSVILSGNMESQYQQWSEILREMYRADAGSTLLAGEPTN